MPERYDCGERFSHFTEVQHTRWHGDLVDRFTTHDNPMRWHDSTTLLLNNSMENKKPERTDYDDEKDDVIETKKPFFELEKHAKDANERLRVFLMGLSQPEMVARIKQLELSDRSLNFLCEGIALEKEDYEICMAVEAIKRERAQVTKESQKG